MYNLTENQKAIVRWMVGQVRVGKLAEEFMVTYTSRGAIVVGIRGSAEDPPEIGTGALRALEACGAILVEQRSHGTYNVTLLGSAYQAVDNDFELSSVPDISFVPYLSAIPDLATLDDELRDRCLHSLSGASNNPSAWAVAAMAASALLETRLRDVAGIADPAIVGHALVNRAFGQNGTLVGRISVSAESQGYRDLFAGIVAVFRNPAMHRFEDLAPERGGAYIRFVDLLLKMLEDLRSTGP